MKLLIFSFLFSPFGAFTQNKDQTKTDTSLDHYYSLLRDYQQGKMEIYTPQNIKFVRSMAGDSKGAAFEFFSRHSDEIDSVMNDKRYSGETICYLISKVEVDPILERCNRDNVTPDWIRIRNTINQKYKLPFTDNIILDAKLRWYGYRKKWEEYTKYLIQRVEKYGPYRVLPDQDFRYNSDAWDLFQYSTNNVQLEKALNWSDSAIRISSRPNPDYFDTYANLLYKLGRIQEAIAYEEKAKLLAPNAKDIQSNLEKMKNGRPTWPKLAE